jgi:asparagine synthase (glutamine-hydrolysing)
MCGIIGHLKRSSPVDRVEFALMRDTLMHRGPDDADAQYFEGDHLALGHRRLSFLDLSQAGRQPMCNEDETVWIVLNGEIYNYIELRELLIQKGHIFKTQTDTEVIIHGYEEWGTGFISRLKGMFAFGLLDLKKKDLLLVRDRFGIKPLYYTQFDDQFIFASELKAIVACRDVKREMDMSSFADYFVYRYIPSPKTIWKNISKLAPAHFLHYNYETGTIKEEEYWRLSFDETKPDTNLAQHVGEMLKASVSIHARSDVPIGSFLSGGYDSSAVVYYLAELGYKPETFSIGFKNWANSEDQYAQLVADTFHVPHTSLIADDASLDLLDIMPDVYDEPIADISILPTWLVSHCAVQKVKAVMSGEGADELFGGYAWQKKFFADDQALTFAEKNFPAFLGGKKIDTVAFYAEAMAMGRFDSRELRELLQPAHHTHIAEDTDWFYRRNFDNRLSPLKSIQRMDIKCFMGELVLTKIDRASMANSLEVRVPFLDHELFEKVLSQKETDYFKPAETKHLLFQNIKDHLPAAVLDRSKQGFVGPDSFYMNIDRYQQILDRSALIADGIVRGEYYQRILADRDHWRLWKLAVMETWYAHWIKN